MFWFSLKLAPLLDYGVGCTLPCPMEELYCLLPTELIGLVREWPMGDVEEDD